MLTLTRHLCHKRTFSPDVPSLPCLRILKSNFGSHFWHFLVVKCSNSSVNDILFTETVLKKFLIISNLATCPSMKVKCPTCRCLLTNPENLLDQNVWTFLKHKGSLYAYKGSQICLFVFAKSKTVDLKTSVQDYRVDLTHLQAHSYTKRW